MGLQGTLRDRLADFFEIELGRSSKRETDREGEREGKLPCSSAEADTDAVEREEERVVVAKERERERERERPRGCPLSAGEQTQEMKSWSIS
jgi:hypothetical protein